MKIHRCSAWLFAGLICLAALLMFTTNLPRRDAFHGKNVRDWAVKLSYAPEQKQRTAAATSLRNLGPDAVPALVEMLRAKSPFYQPLLAKLAFLLPAKPQDAVMRSAWLVDGAGLRLGATRALASLGPAARAAIPELTAAIHDADSRIGYSSLSALGKIGCESLPVLTAAMEDSNAEIRRYATQAFGKLGTNGSHAMPLLTARLSDQVELVRIAATNALHEINGSADMGLRPCVAIPAITLTNRPAGLRA